MITRATPGMYPSVFDASGQPVALEDVGLRAPERLRQNLVFPDGRMIAGDGGSTGVDRLDVPGAAPMKRVAWRLSNGRTLLVFHSPHARCGIAEYGRQLDEAFGLPSAAVPPLGALNAGDVVLVHYELGLMSEADRLVEVLSPLRARSVAVVACCHYFAAEVPSTFAAAAHVVHRSYPGADGAPTVRRIPLACPVYEPTDRAAQRRRFGLPADAIVVTTAGFLSRRKHAPEALAAILRFAPANVHVQLLMPHPFSHRDRDEEDAIREIADDHPGRVTWVSDFLPEQEALDRVACSDLGFVYAGEHTGSVSAATKQFVSARVPLVVTHSTHLSDVERGVVRVGSFEVGAFGRAVAETAAGDQLGALALGMKEEYSRVNAGVVAREYLKLFAEVTR